MDYVHLFIELIKRWSSFFGLTSRQNYEDAFYQLLHDKKYDDAIRLAQQYDYLDIDLVYKCKWRNSGITVASINATLGNIQDKLWSINECVQTVPISHEACRTLIEFGLKEANLRLLYQLGYETSTKGRDRTPKIIGKKFIFRGNSSSFETIQRNQSQSLTADDLSDDELEGLIDFNDLNDQQLELCRCRQDLLRHEHSLFAYENILGDYRAVQQQFNHVLYDEFRRKCPLNACMDFAHEGDSHAIETMLNFFTDDLSPHLLPILSNIPETMSPYQYRNLLPYVREGDAIYEWRALTGPIKRDESDWSSRVDSQSSFTINLRTIAQEFADEFYAQNPSLKKYVQVLTPELLTEWYIERALEIESRTLLLSSAIQLLHLGMELNIGGLKLIHDDLKDFGCIVYDCLPDDQIYMDYSAYKKMPEFDKILLRTGNAKMDAKYNILAESLLNCKDPSGVLSAKILDHVIDLRKRDEKIQLAYVMRHM